MLRRSLVIAILATTVVLVQCGKLRIPKAASTITLSTTTATWTAGLCVPVTLALTQSGSEFVVPGTTSAIIGLTGSLSNVKFFETAADCTAVTPAVTSTTVAAATSSKTFYVRSTTSGTLTVTTRLTGYTGTPISVNLVGTKDFTVYADTPVDFIFARQAANTDLGLADTLATTAGCIAYYLYLKDTYGNRVSATDFNTLYTATYSALPLSITRNAIGDGTTVFYNDSSCGGANPVQDPPGGVIPAGTPFTNYPAIFSVDPTLGTVSNVITLLHDLSPTITTTPTLSITIN